MDISQELRDSVILSLPEVQEIKDQNLRCQVIEAWSYSLAHSFRQPGHSNSEVWDTS